MIIGSGPIVAEFKDIDTAMSFLSRYNGKKIYYTIESFWKRWLFWYVKWYRVQLWFIIDEPKSDELKIKIGPVEYRRLPSLNLKVGLISNRKH